jgi:hypothetical protein
MAGRTGAGSEGEFGRGGEASGKQHCEVRRKMRALELMILPLEMLNVAICFKDLPYMLRFSI